MFHFPASPPAPYEFRHERPGTTPARFPHSDTLGSKPACRLPEAYRRLQRPSSAPGTQASTERPTTPTTTRTHTQRAGTDARVHYTVHNQPTHTHPRTPATRSPRQVRQPGRTAPEPRQHATPTHAGAPTTSRPPRPQQPQQPTKAGVSPMPAPDKPTTPHTSARRSAARPSVRSSPGRPRPIQRPRQQRPGSHPPHNINP